MFRVPFHVAPVSAVAAAVMLVGVGSAQVPELPERVQPRRVAATTEKDGVEVRRDLAYAEGDDAWRLDLYLPSREGEDTGHPPLIVWIHGGGWNRGSKSRVPASFRRLATVGYALASIEYRLTGLRSHPDQIHDCKGAIRWLRANADELGFDASRVGVGGGSAGGHLALLLGTSGGVARLEGDVGGNRERSSRVQAIVDLFGPSDARLMAAGRPGRGLGELEEIADEISPVTHVTEDDPPLLILHGDADTTVPKNQSERIHASYRDAGLDSTLHVIPGAGHGGAVFFDEPRSGMVEAFYDLHVRGDEAAAERLAKALAAAEKADRGDGARRGPPPRDGEAGRTGRRRGP